MAVKALTLINLKNKNKITKRINIIPVKEDAIAIFLNLG